MEFEQVKDLLTVIRLNYPQSFRDYTKQQSVAYMDMMYEAFKDDPAELVVSAVKSIIYSDTREFAPNIGQIKNKMYELSHTSSSIDAQGAWSLVKKALRRSGWYAQEEFESLPTEVQDYIGDAQTLHEWSQMDTQTLDSVVASNFLKNFKARTEKKKEFDMLPSEIKQMIGTITDKKLLGE